MKASFLKRVLCVSKYTPMRLVYELARKPFFVEELKGRVELRHTIASEEHITGRTEKRRDICEDFYCTKAMMNRAWITANYSLRNMVMCFVVNGFHHKMCRTKSFHTMKD